jgi:hypothetical protein
MRQVLFAAFFLILVNASIVMASGDRHAVVTADRADQYRVLTLKQFLGYEGRLRYIGSTRFNHIFLISRTTVANGRPFDTIFKYRIPVTELNIRGGWSLGNNVVKIAPHQCPGVRQSPQKPPSFYIENTDRWQKRCLGTGRF